MEMNSSENEQNTDFNHQNVENLIYNLENIKKNLEDIINLKRTNNEISKIIDKIKEFLSWINQFIDENREKSPKDYEKREAFIKELKENLEEYFKSNKEMNKLVEISKLIKESKSILEFIDNNNIEFNPSEFDDDKRGTSINCGIPEENMFYFVENQEKSKGTLSSFIKDNYSENNSSENLNKININNSNNKSLIIY